MTHDIVYIYHHTASYTSAIGVFAPLAGRKTPPAQVAEAQRDRAAASIGASWSRMQQEHATRTSMGTYCKCPVPLTLISNLRWWCFPSSQWRKDSNCTRVTCTAQWCLYVVHVLVYMWWWSVVVVYSCILYNYVVAVVVTIYVVVALFVPSSG